MHDQNKVFYLLQENKFLFSHLCKIEILIWKHIRIYGAQISCSREEIGTGMLAGGNNDSSSVSLLTCTSVSWRSIDNLIHNMQTGFEMGYFPLCILMYKSLIWRPMSFCFLSLWPSAPWFSFLQSNSFTMIGVWFCSSLPRNDKDPGA